MLKKLGLSLLILTSSFSVIANEKAVIGATAKMSVAHAELSYVARIDTGAVNTSLHAYDIVVEGGSAKNMKDNVGKMVSFTTENNAGESKRLTAKIVKTSTVSNSQGTETRYMVDLDVGFKGKERKVRVNLRDRSHMDYKLLIGRNWLKGRYVVDVSEKKIIGPTAPISVVESGLIFKTRIDTGAVENSLHALDIKIDNEDPDMEKNVGKIIHFTTENEKGESHVVKSRIVETSLIRNAQGSEIRYMVELNIGEPGQEYKVKVNLRDRSKMSYKLLIGRNWLQGHYIVDVSR
ncbi:putative ATP-dependent zinc protease [Shewanella fidelis]|uniref:RimK/LysX family protein n=1 Tax=Shewanella fidelis TaxID=173509 RepID=A0AAW8NNP1_9GAMM|nr:RimK/LysX family protein [Shewanella fidelis]MDR8524136.1 RimK/LysX family protein [Shewanella fidelis]MDW4810683.1 RimK/LysX family protein [Shewanella fidelis]MDW4814804.1 RimK/LysX family protein [Shewanella fidelis]MDW4818894.1 RimK/LysX family protein [Shewanella fidelis]MDW4823429.1 RimK/LysX family protein [Shewanella fidelis]